MPRASLAGRWHHGITCDGYFVLWVAIQELLRRKWYFHGCSQGIGSTAQIGKGARRGVIAKRHDFLARSVSMPHRWWNWKSGCLFGAVFLGLHCLYLAVLASHYPLWSNYFMCAAPVAACVVCCVRACTAAARSRTG